MVAIDSSHDIPISRPAETSHTGTIVLFAILGSALLVTASLAVGEGGGWRPVAGGNSWQVAAEMVSRFSLLLFVAAMIVEPLARLFPVNAMQALGRERGSLTLAFATASAISLGCVAAPSQLGPEHLSVPALAYCALTALVLVVMVFSGHPAAARSFGAPAWRALHRVATSYFWMVFIIAGIEHLVGPHLPDDWHGFSLLLLIAAVLLRFADSFVAHWRFRDMAGKVA